MTRELPPEFRNIKTEPILINKAIAEEMLTHNKPHQPGVVDTNRKVSPATVRRYATIMLRNGWRLTHQGIAFKANGDLEDGQQRLMAIVEAAKTNPDIAVWMMVTRGFVEATFPYLDQGRRRKIADVASSAGITNGTQAAATAKLFFSYMQVPFDKISDWHNPDAFTAEVMVELFHTYPNLAVAVDRVRNNRFTGNITAISTFMALALELRPDVDVEKFIYRLETGMEGGDGEPAWELRERLIRLVRTGKNQSRVEQLAYCIKAFNAWMRGEKVHSLRFSPGTDAAFPRILAAQDATLLEGLDADDTSV